MMTETQEAIRPVVALGQAVGQAEVVLSRLLADVLAQTGTSRETYLAMGRLTVLGGAAAHDAYIYDLSDWLELDLWTAQELAASLISSGVLAEADGAVRLSLRGEELRRKINGSVSAVTATLLAPLDGADVETTIRTLQEVTARAAALRARANTTEGYP
jgi:hypothetical protein